MKKNFNEGNQIHNFMSSSGSGSVINYGSGSGSDFLTSYSSGSGSKSQKVPVPVPVPQHCLIASNVTEKKGKYVGIYDYKTHEVVLKRSAGEQQLPATPHLHQLLVPEQVLTGHHATLS
jgi:hypothetical protein